MKETLKRRMEALVKRAKDERMVFVFGDEVYTPDEALDAVVAHADDDMEYHGWTEDECIDNVKGCMYEQETAG